MTPLTEGEQHDRKVTHKTPTCAACAHYWPTVHGRRCMYPLAWEGGEPEAIDADEMTKGDCAAFEYRSTRIGCSDE